MVLGLDASEDLTRLDVQDVFSIHMPGSSAETGGTAGGCLSICLHMVSSCDVGFLPAWWFLGSLHGVPQISIKGNPDGSHKAP